jgi:hypothetical protein
VEPEHESIADGDPRGPVLADCASMAVTCEALERHTSETLGLRPSGFTIAEAACSRPGKPRHQPPLRRRGVGMPVMRLQEAVALPARELARLLALAFLALATNLSHAQVWKCMENERTVFSDMPCPKNGRQLDQRQLNANTVQGYRAPAARDIAEPAPAQAFSVSSGASGTSVCPTDLEIRNMEVKGSSITLQDAERDFLNDEIRRARQCRKGQGNYSAADWQASREAQADQSSLDGRERGRRRAEGVHSAADPVEGDRIERRQLRARSGRRQEGHQRE